MIQLNDVTKKYDGTTVVDNLSLQIDSGELCVLIGLSGCGKSTTLKMINRLVEPSAGEILLDGECIKSWAPEILRRKIGYVIQDIGLFPHWTVEQNIAVVLKLLKWKPQKIRDRVTELLELFNLKEDVFRRKYPDQLSGGQAQRVGVARALASDPKVLLMDEPFGALDPITRDTLQSELTRIQQDYKKTIIFVTHDIDEAIRLANKIVIMEGGRCIQYDTPEEILENPANTFVRNFIGTDRGLRRLARLSVKDKMQIATSIQLTDSFDLAKELYARSKTVWIVDAEGKLLGWLGDISNKDGTNGLGKYLFEIDSEYPVNQNSLMKEAVSRMLWQSVQCVPVVNDQFILQGEIRFVDILNS